MKYKLAATGAFGCGALVLAFNLALGGWSVRYLAEAFAHKVVPWGWAIVLGLVGGEVTIPIAAIVWILKHVGVL